MTSNTNYKITSFNPIGFAEDGEVFIEIQGETVPAGGPPLSFVLSYPSASQAIRQFGAFLEALESKANPPPPDETEDQ